MASFDLSDLVEDFVYAISAPGVDDYATVSDDEWVSRLRDGFWTGFNYGMFREYTESDGAVTNRSDTSTVFPTEYQQMVILFASVNVLTKQMLSMNTLFRTKAGPVEYETQQSATLLNTILNALIKQRDDLLAEWKRGASTNGFFVLDTYSLMQGGYRDGYTSWVGN